MSVFTDRLIAANIEKGTAEAWEKDLLSKLDAAQTSFNSAVGTITNATNARNTAQQQIDKIKTMLGTG